MIDGDDIEYAEATLKRAVDFAPTIPTIVYDRANVEPNALDRYVSHHCKTIEAMLDSRGYQGFPDEVEGMVATMLRHFFLAGCLARANNGMRDM